MPVEFRLDIHVEQNSDGFFVATCSQYPGIRGVSSGVLAAIDELLSRIYVPKRKG